MIGQSAQKLRQLGLDFDAVDLADMLWLAQFIELDGSAHLKDDRKPDEKPKTVRQVDVTDVANNEPAVNIYIDDRQEHPSSDQSSTSETPSKPPPGIPFPVPAAPALRVRLDLARALRPLMRKVPSQNRYELDEDATVTQIAETQMMIPIVRSRPERWLDLDLVVEDSKTTVIWERTIAELQHLLEYQGAFRTVRTWRLAVAHPQTAKAEDVKLFPRWRGSSSLNQRPRSPRELLDPGSRRLILVVTDCTSLLWQRGIIHETLWHWAELQPLSIVQLFPERLWMRTALSNGHIVRLGATAPGVPSARLEISGLSDLDSWDEFDDWDEGVSQSSQERTDEKRRLVLPIVTLDPKAMNRWARVISGGGDTLTPGRFFELKVVRQMAMDFAESDLAAHAAASRTARQRVALFKATASVPALALAKCMAATPVSLPVIDLLRDEFVTDARQEHVAEVLLSGLLQRIDQSEDNERCQYEFFGDRDDSETPERVRDLLLDDVPVGRTVSVLNRLSQLIQDKAGNTLKSFEAFLAAFDESGEALGKGALPLATIGLEVLHRLGGSHAALAKQYERGSQTSKLKRPDQPTGDDFFLKDLEYEAAQFINFPALQSCEYQSATILTILDRFNFETAKIEQEIRRRPAVAWGYTELLRSETGEDIGLDMISIPGGKFRMGAPKSEPKSSGKERPQHEVTLQPFYLGRYAITQAQWRMVAGYDRINRDLNPDPSQFKGDNLPVERVRWEDTQEFCQRLSAKTSKDYHLPSEAQWEYACRAGTETPFHFGERITTELANYNGDYTYNGSPKGEYRAKTIEVGSFPANDWGLHDMHGNVWERCEDDYHGSYDRAPNDGSAWVDSDRTKTSRLLRGGSWFINPGHCRSAGRNDFSRDNSFSYVGFRVCCVPPRLLLGTSALQHFST